MTMSNAATAANLNRSRISPERRGAESRSGFPGGPREEEPEELVFVHDRQSGLRAAISIQSTVLGPALGGCRFRPYPTTDDALEDVIRLGRAMTSKSSIAGLDLGGGKSVIIGDPRTDRTEARLRAFGRMIEGLGGRYLTGEDVGTTPADMDVIGEVTKHVLGRSIEKGGFGDPSGSTALGVFEAMQATVGHVTGAPDLAGTHALVVGVGKVGHQVVGRLVAAGVRVTVSDIADEAVKSVREQFDVAAVPLETAHQTRCDVFVPCALGGVLNASTIGELRCRMIVGSANNQLGEDADADRLADAGIVYAPDFVVNAGGLIHVADELHGFDAERVEARVRAIGPTTLAILAEADTDGITPLTAANRKATRRIDQHRRIAA